MRTSSAHTPDSAPDCETAQRPAEDRLVLTLDPKVFCYLDLLVEKDRGFGDTRQDVARRLIWDGINSLIERGLLEGLDS